MHCLTLPHTASHCLTLCTPHLALTRGFKDSGTKPILRTPQSHNCGVNHVSAKYRSRGTCILSRHTEVYHNLRIVVRSPQGTPSLIF